RHRRRVVGFDHQRQRHHDVADNDDDAIGRKIVGAVRAEIQSANRAVIGDFQESTKQFALAAARAAAAQASLQGGPQVALFGRPGFPLPDDRLAAHGFHDLPFIAFPILLLPCLRSLSRGLRPGWALVCGLEASWRLRPRGASLPSDNSSNRSAPATGAASTRRTSTTSPNRCMAPLREPTSACRVSSQLKYSLPSVRIGISPCAPVSVNLTKRPARVTPEIRP